MDHRKLLHDAGHKFVFHLWGLAFSSLKHLIDNLALSALLAFKIWTVARQSAQYRSNNVFGPVLRVIIESGAIYSMTITAALISFVVKSPGVYVVLDMVSHVSYVYVNRSTHLCYLPAA